MAGAFYSFAIFVTCISPFLFVCSIIVNEIVVWAYPVTESYDAIGQVIVKDPCGKILMTDDVSGPSGSSPVSSP